MNEITNATEVANEVFDNSIVRNFTKLQEIISNTGMFQCDNLQLKITKDIGTVTIPMVRQHMADDFLSELTSFLDVNVLYAYKKQDGSSYRIVAYTMPFQDEMYIVSVDSQQYGIVEEMYVTLFESLDIMFKWLHKGYEMLLENKDQIEIIEQQDLTSLYKNFV